MWVWALSLAANLYNVNLNISAVPCEFPGTPTNANVVLKEGSGLSTTALYRCLNGTRFLDGQEIQHIQCQAGKPWTVTDLKSLGEAWLRDMTMEAVLDGCKGGVSTRNLL